MTAPLPHKLREKLDRIGDKYDYPNGARKAVLAAVPLIAEHVANRCAEICRNNEFTQKAATEIERAFKEGQ